MSIELSFLAEAGYVEARTTHGYLRQMPPAIQHSNSITVIDHIFVDIPRIMKTTIRSPEDLLYLMNTVGVSFGFSTAEFAATIRRAMDIYLAVFTTPLVNQLKPIDEDQQTCREQFLVEAFRQMSLIVEIRHDYPAGSVHHLPLVARVVDHWSKMLAAHEGTLSAATWTSILKILLGCLDYVCTPGTRSPPECRLTIASIVFEAIVRSRTRNTDFWVLLAAKLPNTLAAVAQWAVTVTALTRVVGNSITKRALPPCIPLAWRGIIDPTRNVSNLTTWTIDDILYLWKKLCALVNPLRLKDVEALNLATVAIRDSAMILATSSFWRGSHGTHRDGAVDIALELAVCSRYLPLGPSTDSILRVWGDALLHTALGSSMKTQKFALSDLDESRTRGLEGLCAVMLRRETEVSCPGPYWQAFVRIVEEVCESGSNCVKGHLLLNVLPLFALDLVWPLPSLRKLCVFACEILAELGDADTDVPDEDDDDGAAAKPADMVDALQAVQDSVDMQRAAVTFVLNCAVVAITSRDVTVVTGVMTALQLAANRFLRSSVIYQRVLSAVACIYRESAAVAEIREAILPLIEETVRGGLDALSAPCGSYDPLTLTAAIRFLPCVAPSLSAEILTAVTLQLSSFATAARRLLEVSKYETDVESLSSLFSVACEALCEILCHGRCSTETRSSGDVLSSLMEVVNAGFKSIVGNSLKAYNLRLSAHRLLRAIEQGWMWPIIDGASETSDVYCEGDLIEICKSIVVFGLSTTRIVTLCEVSRSAVESKGIAWCADCDVVMIVRSQHGKRVWCIRKNVAERAPPQPSQLGSPKLVPSGTSSFPSVPPMDLDGALGQSHDVFKYVADQERTGTMLDSWTSDPEISLLLDLAVLPFAPSMSSVNLPVSSEFSVVDDTNGRSLLLRQLVHCLGFGGGGSLRPLSFTPAVASQLRALDLMDERTARIVDVVYLYDGQSPAEGDVFLVSGENNGGSLDSLTAFVAFCRSLGWGHGDEATPIASGHRKELRPLEVSTNDAQGITVSGQVVFATATTKTTFRCSAVSLQEFATREDADEVDDVKTNPSFQPTCVQPGKVRVLWDSTGVRYDYGATDTTGHKLLYNTVCPSMRRSIHRRRLLDVVVRPLLQPALFNVNLIRPDCVQCASSDQDAPVLWGFPLLHNSVASASALPSLIQKVAECGVCEVYTNIKANMRQVAIQKMVHQVASLSPFQAINVAYV